VFGHHFVSYSRVDAKDFATRLHDALLAGPLSFRAWLDVLELRAGIDDWDEQIVEAIRTCESLIFVMTPDSVESYSVCKDEWTRALSYKKPVIPLRVHPGAELPFRLQSRQIIDFTGPFDAALAKLSNNLRWLASPEGKLQATKRRLGDAQRDLRRADPEQQWRIRDEIDRLREDIAHQQHVIENPHEAERRVQQSIQRGLELEREPEKPASGVLSTKFINPPPGMVPSYFRDRHVETKLLGDFLKNDALSLITVVGRGGIGKTVVACRLLKSLESGRLPDDGESLSVDGIVYLSEAGTHQINVPNLYADLCRLLPDNAAEELEKIYKDPQATTEAKMHALLEAFPSGRYVPLLDNFENVLDPETRTIRDAELDEALRALLNLPGHPVKVIVTTRFAPHDLALVQPGRQARLDLDEGLPSPYAENILREMDVDGKVGLKTAPDELLDQARQRTRGNPRALEALFAILSADRDTSLLDILDDTEGLLPENVVEVLVGEAFSRLERAAQMVMQALAVYARPVTPAAIDYLLQPHLLGVDSTPVLKRLVNMQLARKEAGRYYLHEVDRAYALSRVPRGEVTDREETDAPPFTRFALLHRAANYFEQTRTPQESWKGIEDLAPQSAEFDLRYAGQDYDKAASVLLEVDFDYLLFWGHPRLVTQLHEGLQGKLSDPQLEQHSVRNLGSAYYNLGRYEKAITCYEKALEIAREIGDRGGESKSLSNLGSCYFDLGQTERALDYQEQALEIAREIGARGSEGISLGNLGTAYYNWGEYEKAITYLEPALEIAREIGDRHSENAWLGNLGEWYALMGQNPRAIDCCEQALEIAHEIGDRNVEANILRNLGDLHLDQGEWDTATRLYHEAIQIADEIAYSQEQNGARKGLAQACLSAGDLTAARTAAEAARQYDFPRGNANLLTLLGVIALRQGDRAAAQEAFEGAVAEAEALLIHSKQNYGALDSKGLALCGLALCEENSDHISAAIDAYRAARAMNKDAGIVRYVLRLFDELVRADSGGILAEVRSAAD
jgi:tetratricopeptide (TPR) repeat protein